jgi:Domain of unknown function (DUF4359)
MPYRDDQRHTVALMRTASLLVLVILLAAAVGLAATNPSTEQYTAFLQASLNRALTQMEEAESSSETKPEKKVIREILKSQGTQVIQSLTHSNTVRRDFGLFSIFETSAFGVRVQVLGIGTRFVPLEDEEAMIRKLGRFIL